MKAYGAIEPLNFVSYREFLGIDSETPYVAGKRNLIAGTGWTLDHFPLLQTRKTTETSYASLFSSTTNPISMVTYNNNVYVAASSALKKIDGTSYAGALSNSDEVSFTKFKGNLGSTKLIFSNGTDLKKFDGTTVSNLLPGGYAVTVNGYYITSHKNRLFCTSNRTTTLLFSALNKADDWASANDAGSIEIDDNADQTITAIYSANDRLFVFRDNSFYELLGTGPSNFRLIKVSSEVGAINNRSVVSINGVLYFAHYTGIYSYVSGSIPQKISTPIDNIRQLEYYGTAHITDIRKSTVLGTDNSNLYLTTYVGSNGLITYYKQTYQFSPKVNQWTGFSPKNIQAFTMLNNDMYYATNDVNVYKMKDRDALDTDDFPFFAWLPLMDYGTTMGSVFINRIRMRYSGNQSAQPLKVYLYGKNSNGQYSEAYDVQNRLFPLNGYIPASTGLTLVYTDNSNVYEYPTDKTAKIYVPRPLNQTKPQELSIVIAGYGQFILHEIAVDFSPIPTK